MNTQIKDFQGDIIQPSALTSCTARFVRCLLLCALVVLFSLYAFSLTGCAHKTQTQVRRQTSVHSVAEENVHLQREAGIPNPPVDPGLPMIYDGYGAKFIKISPNGAYIAIGAQSLDDTWLLVYRTSDNAQVARYHRDFAVGGAAWHPWKPLITFTIGVQDHELYRLLDVRTGKALEFNPTVFAMSDALDWMTDGRGVIDGKLIYTPQGNGRYVNIELHSDYGGTGLNIAVANNGNVALEIGEPYLDPSIPVTPPSIEIFHKVTGKAYSYNIIGKLPPNEARNTGKTISYPTQPSFLNSGRLGYVRVFLKPNGDRERLELWSCKQDGSDNRKWIDMPSIRRNFDYGKEQLNPISWSRDGKLLVYQYGPTKQIYVKHIIPPADH